MVVEKKPSCLRCGKGSVSHRAVSVSVNVNIYGGISVALFIVVGAVLNGLFCLEPTLFLLQFLLPLPRSLCLHYRLLVCLFFWLFVCLSAGLCKKNPMLILMRLVGAQERGPRKNLFNFRADPQYGADPGYFFFIYIYWR